MNHMYVQGVGNEASKKKQKHRSHRQPAGNRKDRTILRDHTAAFLSGMELRRLLEYTGAMRTSVAF